MSPTETARPKHASRASRRLLRRAGGVILPGSGLYFLSGFTLSLVYATTIPLLPTLRDSFDLDNQEIALLGFMTGLGMLATNAPIGRLIRRSGSRLAMICGMVPAVAACLTLATATSFWQLLAGSALIGIAFAAMLTTTMAALSEMAEPQRLGTAMGSLNGVMTFGMLIGPVVSGLVAAYAGWRASFAVSGVIAALVLLAGLVSYRRIRSVGVEPRSRSPQPAADLGRRRLGAGLFGGLARPLLLAFFLYFMMIYSRSAIGQFLFPIVGQDRVGLSVGAVGAMLSLGTLVTMITVVPIGVLADRYGSKLMLLLGTLAMIVCELLLIVTPSAFGFTLSMVMYGLASTGVSLTYTLFGTISRERSLQRSLGTFRFSGDLGIVLGPISMGALIERLGFNGGLAVTLAVAMIAVPLLLVSLQPVALRRGSIRPTKIP